VGFGERLPIFSVNTNVKRRDLIIGTAAILPLLYAVGCSKKGANIVTDFKLKSNEVDSALSSLGVMVSGHIADAEYALPAKSSVEGMFSRNLWELLNTIKSASWTEEDNDCDNFADVASWFAQYLHHNTPNKLQKTGLAFGSFWYNKDDGSGGHAINFFLYRENGQAKVGFYEPQTQSIVRLSEGEIASCSFWKV
jgi:hypothetical protein